MGKRVTQKDEFYAGETVKLFVFLTEEDTGLPEKVEPDGDTGSGATNEGVTVQVKDITEATEILAETPLVLQAVDSGQADNAATTNATATTDGESFLQDDSQNWEPDEHVGRVVKITGGTGSGQARRVKRNTKNRLYTEPESDDTFWDTQPDATSQYDIHEARYETNWDTPSDQAGNQVSVIFRTKHGGATLINKLRLLLKGVPP